MGLAFTDSLETVFLIVICQESIGFHHFKAEIFYPVFPCFCFSDV